MSTPPTLKDREFPNLALLRHGTEQKFLIKTRGLSLVMRPLSIMEEDTIDELVIGEMMELPDDKKTSIKRSAKLSIKKLVMGNTSDVGLTDSKIHAIELERMTAGELDHLFKQYISGCEKLNPILESFDRKEVVSWVEHLKKNSTAMDAILTESSFFQLVALCRHLLTTEGSPEAS